VETDLFNAESAAYQQLLNTTGSSFNLTDLPSDELDSDDDVEKNIVPKRPPGPISIPQQPAAAAADSAAHAEHQEVPKQPAAAVPSAGAVPNSAKNTDSKEKRFHSFVNCINLG